MITKIRDTDRVLINALLDSKNYKDLLSLLSTTKYLLRLGEETLKQRMFSTHPVLANRKPFFENWRSYYLKVLHNINKLKEEFNINYIPTPSFIPEDFYHGLYIMKLNIFQPWIFKIEKDNYIANYLSEYGDKEKIMSFSQNNNNFSVIPTLTKYKKLDMLDEILEKIPLNSKYDGVIYGAAASGDKKYFEKILKKYKISQLLLHHSIFYQAIGGSISSGNIEMFNYMLENYKDENTNVQLMRDVLVLAARKGHVTVLKSFLTVENSFLSKRLPKIIRKFLTSKYTISFLSEKKSLEVLKTLIEGYCRLASEKIKNPKKKLIAYLRSRKIFNRIKDPSLKNYIKKVY